MPTNPPGSAPPPLPHSPPLHPHVSPFTLRTPRTDQNRFSYFLDYLSVHLQAHKLLFWFEIEQYKLLAGDDRVSENRRNSSSRVRYRNLSPTNTQRCGGWLGGGGGEGWQVKA